jgi:hypothetical protein
MKIAFIEAMLPELKGGKMYQTGRGEASNSTAAISRAFKEVLKKVKAKRVTIIRATITLTVKADNEVQFIHSEDDNIDENVRNQHDD